MNTEALAFMKQLKVNFEKQIANCDRKMKKYPPTVMGYKDAAYLKEEVKKQLEIVNYIINVLEVR